jgi:hypothetical protein
VEVKFHAFLISELGEDDWSASYFGCIIPGERDPVPTGQETMWPSELFWMWDSEWKTLAPAREHTGQSLY